MDTGRTVNEVHEMIEDHLRSLRDKNIDMKSLIEVKQAKGQDYTSLCNEIRDKALFADTRNVTEDILLIAVLVKAVQDTTDVQEVLKSKPKTFDEARKALLALECAKKCAQSLQDDRKEIGAMKTPYAKTKYDTGDKQEDDKYKPITGDCLVCKKSHALPFCCSKCKTRHYPFCSKSNEADKRRTWGIKIITEASSLDQGQLEP